MFFLCYKILNTILVYELQHNGLKKERKRRIHASEIKEMDSCCTEYSVAVFFFFYSVCNLITFALITDLVDLFPPPTREEVGLVVSNLASVTISIPDAYMMLLLIINCQNF